jgi:hypothetical protein
MLFRWVRSGCCGVLLVGILFHLATIATLPLFQLSTFSSKRFLVVFLFSVELIGSRWWRSLSVIKAVSKKEHTCPPALFLHADIMDCSTFSPFTHVYTFDRGFRKSMLLYVLVSFLLPV